VTTVTAGVMYGALNQGWGDLDYASLFKTYEMDFARFVQRAELASKREELTDAGAGSVVHDEPESYSEVMPFEVVADSMKPEDAAAASQALNDDDEKDWKISSSAESSQVEMPELKPILREPEPSVRSDSVEAELKSAAGEYQPGQAKTSEEKNTEDEKKGDEFKPDAIKSADSGPDAVKEVGSKVEAVTDVNGGTASPGIEGEGDVAKPVHPFNRILRRFFTPAGK
jgi:hypothetical protein